MTLPSKDFNTFVTDMVTAWAANVGITPALQPGDALFALMQAVCAQFVFIQAQVQIVNNVARAQTSTGADLDSFYAQFDFPRLPATFMTGPVIFSNPAALPSQVLIPAGTIVQTPGGAVQYQVVADSGQPTWNATLNAYVLTPGQTSLTATAQALVAGTASNVIAGALSQIASNVPGITAVTNASPINNGLDAESDIAYRARFVLYLAGLSKATQAAILAAIASVQQNITTNLLENIDNLGDSVLGTFTAVVDDGSGDPPDALINTIYNAVYAARGFTIVPHVVKATTVHPTITLNISVAAGFDPTATEAAAQAAVVAAINSLPLTTRTLYISFIESAALSAAGVAGVQPGQTKINSSNSDLALTNFQEVRVTNTNVTVGTY